LVLCNDRNFVFNTSVDTPFCSSDHGTVAFNVIRDLRLPKHDVNSIDFSKADWTNLSAYFDNINFFSLFENCLDTASIVNAFYTVLYAGLNQFVPVYSSHSNYEKKMYSYKIRKMMTRKSLLWRIYRRLRTPDSLSN
jgi:hypothetical protein